MAGDIGLVLVTGVSGFIANHVLQQLLQAGHRVRGTVRSLSNQTKVQAVRDIVPDAGDRLELVECDLLDASRWLDVVSGCSHVIHIASPLPAGGGGSAQEEEAVIRPAVEGTKAVLAACAESGTVQRVVLTSSVMAICGTFNGRKYSEEDWADLNEYGITPYSKSKTIAEQAAWDFVKELPEGKRFELVALNPGVVIGPVLMKAVNATNVIISNLLDGSQPFLMNVCFPLVDVRDVAKVHMDALTADGIAGLRIIVNTDNLYYKEMAETCQETFGSLGYSIQLRVAPDFLLKVFSWVTSYLRDLTCGLSKKTEFDNSRMTSLFIPQPIDMRQSIVDTAHSLIQWGIVPKTAQYEAM